MNPQVQRIRSLSALELEAELKAAEATLAALEAERVDAWWPKPTNDHWPILCTTGEDDWCEDDWCEDDCQDDWPDDAQT